MIAPERRPASTRCAATYHQAIPLALLRQPDTAIADLARALACWLIVILLLQGQVALLTQVHGPAHRHLPQLTPQLMLATDEEHEAHLLAHERGQAHHHGAGEVVVPASGDATLDATLDAAAVVLLASLVPLAMSHAFAAPRARMAFNAAAAAWAFVEGHASLPRRPPRG